MGGLLVLTECSGHSERKKNNKIGDSPPAVLPSMHSAFYPIVIHNVQLFTFIKSIKKNKTKQEPSNTKRYKTGLMFPQQTNEIENPHHICFQVYHRLN